MVAASNFQSFLTCYFLLYCTTAQDARQKSPLSGFDSPRRLSRIDSPFGGNFPKKHPCRNMVPASQKMREVTAAPHLAAFLRRGSIRGGNFPRNHPCRNMALAFQKMREATAAPHLRCLCRLSAEMLLKKVSAQRHCTRSR